MLQFNLNVSIVLREYPFLERFDHAARAGFGAVEFWWPDGEDLRMVAQRIRDAGLQVTMFNFDAGNLAAGDRGFLNVRERQVEFRAHVPVALEFANRIGCTRINALAGHWRPNEDRAAQLDRVRDNLQWAAEQAQAAGVTVLVEALNTWDNGAVIFSTTRDTLQCLGQIGATNLRYQYDVYHMQRMEGNIVATLREHIAQIGHIQVADVPHRHQPGTGEVNYRYIFAALDDLEYSGSIGLEYVPLGTSEDSFAWLPPDRRGAVVPTALRL
jgi:hydroxypyruvate isomerase